MIFNDQEIDISWLIKKALIELIRILAVVIHTFDFIIGSFIKQRKNDV
jgi:hypothetical protein